MRSIPPGWYDDFHPTPKRQWTIIVAGTLELGVSDGAKRIVPAVTVAFIEEAGSERHTKRAIGNEPSTLMVDEID